MNNADINIETDVLIEFDGYICERINYSTQTGYSIFYIKDENKNIIFTHQMNCGVNISYAYDGSFVPVKAGWYFYITGTSIKTSQYRFTHI